MTWPADLELPAPARQASLALGWEESTQVEPPAPSCLLRVKRVWTTLGYYLPAKSAGLVRGGTTTT